jgi:hypothetical protein
MEKLHRSQNINYPIYHTGRVVKAAKVKVAYGDMDAAIPDKNPRYYS